MWLGLSHARLLNYWTFDPGSSSSEGVLRSSTRRHAPNISWHQSTFDMTTYGPRKTATPSILGRRIARLPSCFIIITTIMLISIPFTHNSKTLFFIKGDLYNETKTSLVTFADADDARLIETTNQAIIISLERLNGRRCQFPGRFTNSIRRGQAVTKTSCSSLAIFYQSRLSRITFNPHLPSRGLL